MRQLPPINYSKITRAEVKEYVNKPNPTILEIGAHHGEHTVLFSEMFESPKIYCFEPDPRNIVSFKQRVGDHPYITLFEMAVSSNSGTTELYQSSGVSKKSIEHDCSSSIKKPKNHLYVYPTIKFDQKVLVNTISLDEWCNQYKINCIDFIWMDVQGAEMDVFQGANQALKLTRYLYTEYNNNELYEGQGNLEQILEYLEQFSYEPLIRYPGDILLKNYKPKFKN
ncbi:MAG: FkbM family methyltransferase [Cyanobacteria bacterium]|jgi:FkbM family methyltransferase|nr:FkbM family methyltransferase [Cyanobacteria bacterium GSL.Bin1]